MTQTRAGRWRLLVVCAMVLSVPATRAQTPVRLSAGMSLEADLARGEVHRYEAELTAHSYFAVTLDEANAMVTAVVGPDGTTISLYPAAFGPQPVMVIAPVSGVYRLEVRLLQSGPRAPTSRGDEKRWRAHYRLRVDAIRPPTSEDEERARLAQLVTEAYSILTTPSAGAWERGSALALQALEGWRALGDRLGEARTLYVLGGFAPDFALRVDFGRREIAARHAIGEDYGEAMALLSLGSDLRSMGDVDASRELVERSLRMLRAAGRAANEADVLVNMANAAASTGDLSLALERAYEVLGVARALKDPIRESSALATVGVVHLAFGEFDSAIAAYRTMAALDPDTEATQATAEYLIGGALLSLGKESAAEELFQKRLDWCRNAAMCLNEGGFLLPLAEIHAQRGDFAGARELFEQAVEAAARANLVSIERTARRRLADILLRQGELDAADRMISAAATLTARGPNDLEKAAVLSTQARLALARHSLKPATRSAEEAVRLAESVRGRVESSRLRASLLASGQGAYLTLIQTIMAEDAADPAVGHAARALEISERARARSLLDLLMTSPARPTSARPTALDDLTALLHRINAKAQAADTARRSNNQKFTESLTRELDELTDKFRLAEARLARENPDLAPLTTAEPLSVDVIKRDVLDADTVLLEYMLGEPDSYAWVVSKDALSTYRLPDRRVIETAARSFLQQIADRPATAQRERLNKASLELGRLLLGPLASIATGKRLLVVAPGVLQQVPFAALRVPATGELLVARHEIVHTPSASIVGAVRARDAQQPRARRAIAVFADPVYEASDPRVKTRPVEAVDHADSNRSGLSTIASAPSPLTRALRSVREDRDRTGLARLPFTRQEADAIAGLAPLGAVFKATDFSANLRRATDPSLADYRIVHFATHGLLDARTPELSGLVLSLVDENGRPQDGFLRLTDIGRLRLNADVVVLSGCETALGRSVVGEGIIGLTRSFVVAGARRVVASLWKVDDLATAELMRHFYTEMLVRHTPAAAALRAAQRRMAASSRWRDPYYWAGFVIQGEWR